MTDRQYILWSEPHQSWRAPDGFTTDRRAAQRWGTEAEAQAACELGEEVWAW